MKKHYALDQIACISDVQWSPTTGAYSLVVFLPSEVVEGRVLCPWCLEKLNSSCKKSYAFKVTRMWTEKYF